MPSLPVCVTVLNNIQINNYFAAVDCATKRKDASLMCALLPLFIFDVYVSKLDHICAELFSVIITPNNHFCGEWHTWC